MSLSFTAWSNDPSIVGRIELSEEKLRYLVVEMSKSGPSPSDCTRTAPSRAGASAAARAAGPPVAQPPQQRGPHRRPRARAPPRGSRCPHPASASAMAASPPASDESESHLRQQRETELPNENRILNGAQGVERQQQEEHRGDPRDLGHAVPAAPQGAPGPPAPRRAPAETAMLKRKTDL